MSPLGKYGQIVAAGLATLIIASYVLALIFATALAVPPESLSALDKLAFLAAGAVFGAAAAVNGLKAPVDSAHSRIDKLETATGVSTHGSYPAEPSLTAAELAGRIEPPELARSGRTLHRAAADDLLEREWTGQVVMRAAGDVRERIIEGIVVPFGQVATVRDSPGGPVYRETIERGATDGLDPSTVLLESFANQPASADHNSHVGAMLVGRGIAGEITDAGHVMQFRVSRTHAGDDALELARDGVLTDFSVSFRPVDQATRPDGVVARSAIDVRRVAVLARGAYPGAQVTAVRSAQEATMPATQGNGQATGAAATPAPAEGEATTEETTGQATTPAGERPNRTRVTVDVDRGQWAAFEEHQRAAAERDTVDGLARAGGSPGAAMAPRRSSYSVTRAEAIYGPGSDHSFFRDGWIASGNAGASGSERAEAGARLERHYGMLAEVDRLIQRSIGIDQGLVSRAGDVLSSEIPGAYPSEYMPGLIVNRILKARPMAGFYQRVPLTDGRPRIYPVVTTSTTVAVQSAEGANPAASDFATTGTTVTPLLYGGETKVSRQVLDGADPSTDQMLSTDLTEAYMQASETVVKTAVEAGSAASGVTLTAATPNLGLATLVINHQTSVFLPAEKLFLPSTLLTSWVTQLDSSNRPLAPYYGAVNAFGQVTEAGFGGAVIAGIPVALAWASTAGAGAGVGGVAVIGRSSDFAIFESNIVNFQYDQGAEAPAAVRIGLWAYLVVGTRRGSRKATGA